MSKRISFDCPLCNAPLKAFIRLVGRTCPCPSCKEEIIVPPQIPEEEAPLLIMDDGYRREPASTPE